MTLDAESRAVVTRRLAGPVAVAVAAIARCVTVSAIDPNQAGSYPPCPWLAVTGTFCPGCGTLRAVHALTHGDLGRAVEMNPLTVAAIPVLVVAYMAWLLRSAGTARPAPSVTGVILLPWFGWGFVTVCLAFWIARNTSQLAWLAPG